MNILAIATDERTFDKKHFEVQYNSVAIPRVDEFIDLEGRTFMVTSVSHVLDYDSVRDMRKEAVAFVTLTLKEVS